MRVLSKTRIDEGHRDARTRVAVLSGQHIGLDGGRREQVLSERATVFVDPMKLAHLPESLKFVNWQTVERVACNDAELATLRITQVTSRQFLPGLHARDDIRRFPALVIANATGQAVVDFVVSDTTTRQSRPGGRSLSVVPARRLSRSAVRVRTSVSSGRKVGDKPQQDQQQHTSGASWPPDGLPASIRIGAMRIHVPHPESNAWATRSLSRVFLINTL